TTPPPPRGRYRVPSETESARGKVIPALGAAADTSP
ncbi:MAG: hypothetical protein QOE17_1985, partial [Gaiellales bacterium]|nr:hypothetical protein [Gaiellales bacterium]